MCHDILLHLEGGGNVIPSMLSYNMTRKHDNWPWAGRPARIPDAMAGFVCGAPSKLAYAQAAARSPACRPDSLSPGVELLCAASLEKQSPWARTGNAYAVDADGKVPEACLPKP